MSVSHLGQAADHPEVLPAGQVGIYGGALAGQPDLEAHLVRLMYDVIAHDLGPPPIRTEDRGEYPDRRGLARPIGPGQAEYGPRLDGEVDPVQGYYRFEMLDQSFNDYGVIRHRATPLFALPKYPPQSLIPACQSHIPRFFSGDRPRLHRRSEIPVEKEIRA